MKPCPVCLKTEQVHQVIYYGLPHLLCDCDNVVYGSWIKITRHLPFNGWFFEYQDCSYWYALWHWLTNLA